jgi:hypothetical protein
MFDLDTGEALHTQLVQGDLPKAVGKGESVRMGGCW